MLAIDNEPRVLEGMSMLLRRWGCVVATAQGLTEAREALIAFGPPDLVIADYHLDEGDGIEAIVRCARISAAPSRQSSRPPTGARRRATRPPADIVILHKPLKPAPLRAQLARMNAMREAAE